MKIALLLTVGVLSLPVNAVTMLGCYSSIPDSYETPTEWKYQSSEYCSGQCTEYSYFALTNGGTCACGNEAPDQNDITDGCTTACYGFPGETCGGSSSYNVYSQGNAVAVVASSASDATSQTSTNPTTTLSSTRSEISSQTQQSTTVFTEEQSGSTVVIYSTITPQQSQSSVSSSASSTSSTSSSDGTQRSSVLGPAIGGAVGGVVAIVLVVLAVFFVKRRQDKNKKEAELADSAYFSALKRDNTLDSSHPGHSRQISNPFISKEETMVDQRLNPVMLNRRISEGSLADEADYSRKILRVANPDDH